jgi:hypothetical protein
MLDPGCWINQKKEKFLITSSISPRRRLYEPEARDQHLASARYQHKNLKLKLDTNFKILAYEDTWEAV